MGTETYENTSIEDLLEEIDAAWVRLMETMTSAPQEHYSTKSDPAGWTALDHMAHITAWERSVLFPLMGHPRHEGLGITDEQFAMDFDPINELVREQTAGQPYEQIMADAQKGHQALVNTVDASTLEELWTPTTELCPDQREQERSRPFITVLMSDTSEHYEEHRGYIEKILAS